MIYQQINTIEPSKRGGRPCIPGKFITTADATSLVAGCMCANDVSARDIQTHPDKKQWIKGKSLDGFLPVGSYLLTADEVSDLHDLDISFKLNGVTMQTANTLNLIFRIPYLISHLSQTMTLQAGDIISTEAYLMTWPGCGICRLTERDLSVRHRGESIQRALLQRQGQPIPAVSDRRG